MTEKDVLETNDILNETVDVTADEKVVGTTTLNEGIEEVSEVEKIKSELDEQKDKY